MVFQDRMDAGIALSNHLAEKQITNPVIFALPRGGVPVAFPISQKLGAELDVIIVRKLGVPMNPEYAFGAIAPEGITIIDTFVVDRFQMNEAIVQKVVSNETEELERRINKYRGSLAYPDLEGKTAIVVDDGVATGSTALAAVTFLHKKNPARIIFATPVCAADSAIRIGEKVDEVVSLITPEEFGAVGMWYYEFSQTTDEEVIGFLSTKEGGESK